MKNIFSLSLLCILYLYEANRQVSSRQPNTYKRADKTKTIRLLEERVYVCYSKNAYAYHAYICSGLKRCKASRGEVSVSEARAMGYVACKICY